MNLLVNMSLLAKRWMAARLSAVFAAGSRVAILLGAFLSLFVGAQALTAQENPGSPEGNGDAAEETRTITNIATASWRHSSAQRSLQSNEVRFDVTIPPPVIQAFRASAQGAVELNFTAPQCSTATGTDGSAGGNGGDTGFTPASTQTLNAMVDPTESLRIGQELIFEIAAREANLDSGVIDSLDAQITTPSGESETVRIFETGASTGVFIGRLPTQYAGRQAQAGDCMLGLVDGDVIDIAASMIGSSDVLVRTSVNALADPFGVLFDSESGEPVSGARITIIDATTGQPAVVFAEDGVTPWPSTVISGEAITDGAGRVIEMPPGEYWFPRLASGRYRLAVEPPEGLSAPSQVPASLLAQITRPDGRPFVISDGSFARDFTLEDGAIMQIDIPLDRSEIGLALDKTASRQAVQPGDVVFYSINLTNSLVQGTKRNLTLSDTPSPWLRLRPDTIRIDGEERPEQVAIAPDGSTFDIAIDSLAPGQTVRVIYAMSVRPDAPPGQAVNEASITDFVGRAVRSNAPIDIQRETIADRMTIIGRISAGSCDIRTLKDAPRPGIPGVRVMLEDGSYAITDADGRYHFEGVVPGTHVVQVSRMTLPDGAKLVDCHRSTRNAGSASSRFVIGQGGTLHVADFHAEVPESWLEEAAQRAETRRIEDNLALQVNAVATGANAQDLDSEGEVSPSPVAAQSSRDEGLITEPADNVIVTGDSALEDAASTDWLALGDGPDGWLSPTLDENPRARAVKVAIRHRKGQRIALRVNGEPVDPLAFDGTLNSQEGRFAVSTWRGVALPEERTVLEADIINSFGEVNQTIKREVFFTSQPAAVELVPELSNLTADGRTRPVIAIRVLDRNNRPLREGIAGEFTLNAPYESAEQLDRQQLNQLTGLDASSARWVVEGDDGIALIELAPTMVSGSLRLNFNFSDGDIVREQELETWIEPGDIEWTIVGLAEGSAGARSVADNMQRAGRFDSDLGENARVALYAKGRVLGKYLLTLAYDSAKQREDQRVLGTIDPQAYYTVFADGSMRRFDAASRERLYVRVETATFYALYGDFVTAFDQTRLARYNRTATGVKAEARLGAIKAQGFAAEIATRLRREEIQGRGITGPYALQSRQVLANSERVTIEVRDRFRSEIIVSRRTLTRFIDYDLDLLSGTLRFAEPVLSRDADLNPQFIVVEYETNGLGGSEMNAGVRADWTSEDGAVRVGVSAITDKGEGARTDMGALDLRADIAEGTQLRAELGLSRREGADATGWIVEAQHQTGALDVLAYARQLDDDYGVGQQNGVELGRRKFGVDSRVLLSERLSLVGSLWQDDSLTDNNRRRAATSQLTYSRPQTDLRLGVSHFEDRLADGTGNNSTVVEAGATQRMLGNALELSVSSAIALDNASSVDLPARHRLGAAYAITDDVRLIGTYEIADGEEFNSRQLRGGVEVSPWTGGQLVTTLGEETIGEFGNRSFAAFGLSQNLQVTPSLTLDATIDGNRTLGGTPEAGNLVNPLQPAASGGQLTGNLLFEDFTALTFGAGWRKDRWSLTARGEYRDGELADRTGATFGAIRQVGEGSMVGSGGTWTRAEAINGATTEIFDASIAFAHRPDTSEIAMLGRLEYRSDMVSDAIAGEANGAGRTALIVDGDAVSRRLVASWSTNWSPRGYDTDGNGIKVETRRDEYALFLGARYNFDEFEGIEFSGTSLLAGLDARLGVTDYMELGGQATVRTNLKDDVTSFAYGPTIGFTPAQDVLVTLGYNVEGFRDGDFSAARNTDRGIFAAIRMKFDADSFAFLGLGGQR